jgi:subtilisin-like proprotein convertase family protein
MAEEIRFESLNIKLPELVKTQTPEEQREIFDYLSSMDDHHKKAYEIAFIAHSAIMLSNILSKANLKTNTSELRVCL